jgi:phosphohistidine phosphatase
VILYFLRHGDAGTSLHASGRSETPDRLVEDDARGLSAEGVAALLAGGAVWQRLKLRPDVVLTSPLPRALQTAQLFCDAMGGEPISDDRLRPGGRWPEFARAMADHPDAARVMFVGHEPDLSQVLAQLTGASVRMRKGGLACVEFYGVPEPGGGELAWLIDPDLYAA